MNEENDTVLLAKMITGVGDHGNAPELGFSLVRAVVTAPHPSQLVYTTRLQTSVAPELAQSGLFRIVQSDFNAASCSMYCCCFCGTESQTGESVNHSAACLVAALSNTASHSQVRQQRIKTTQLLSSRDVSQVTGIAWQFGCPKQWIALVTMKAVMGSQDGMKLLPGHILEAWHAVENEIEPNLLTLATKVAHLILVTDVEPQPEEELRVRQETRAHEVPLQIQTDGLRAAAATNGHFHSTNLASDGPHNSPESSQMHQQQQANDQCKSCRRKVLSRTLLPCAHLALCQQCSETNQNCPVCGSKILATIVTYIC